VHQLLLSLLLLLLEQLLMCWQDLLHWSLQLLWWWLQLGLLLDVGCTTPNLAVSSGDSSGCIIQGSEAVP
jgi:hypothetical protein